MKLSEIRNSLIAGDNKAFRYIYQEFGDYCTETLIKQRSCSPDEAEDLFIEAVMILRDKILQGKIQELTNTRYYLYKTAENLFLARLKSEKIKTGKQSELKHFFYASEFANEDDSWDEELADAASKAWNELSERCKDILYYFYVDTLRFAEIIGLMNFSTIDVAKTTKARCYKKLVTTARAYYKEAGK